MYWLSFRLYRLVSWLRHAIPRRFTPAGLLALSVLIASGLVGLDMDQTMAFQGFALLLCLVSVAMAASVFYRARFTAERWLPRFGTVGQPLSYVVRVRSQSGSRLDHLEVLEELADPRPTLPEYAAAQKEETRRRGFSLKPTASPPLDFRQALTRPSALPALPARGQAEVRVEVMPLKRGPLRFVGLTVARPDPFGWFRGFVHVPLPQTVLILPRRYPLPDIPLPGARQYQLDGVALASAIGESEEFVSLRDYRPGDPKRRIHWRSWARLGRPIVKEYEDEFLVRHALILDTFARPGRAAALEEAVSIAASFACTVNTQESLLDLMFIGLQAVCVTSGRGVGQVELTLQTLAAVTPCRSQPFSSLTTLVLKHAEAVCGCVVVLLEWDEPRQDLIRRLRAQEVELLVLVVVGPGQAEEILAKAGTDRPEHFHVLESGKIPEGLLRLGAGGGR